MTSQQGEDISDVCELTEMIREAFFWYKGALNPTLFSSLLMIGQWCIIGAFVWMLYCFAGWSLGCQRQARGNYGGHEWFVYVCVLTWTFHDDVLSDDWCGRENREREQKRNINHRAAGLNENILNSKREIENKKTR